MTSSLRKTLPLANDLYESAQLGHICDNLKSDPLIWTGQLCDDKCLALFSKHHAHIVKNGKIIITGK